MHRALFLFTLALPLSGCSHISKQQKAIAGAAVTAKFVDGAYGTYSTELNARRETCDPAVNPESAVKTKSDLDDCLGKGFDRASHKAIGVALKVYETAARAFEVAISGDDPSARDKAISDLIGAAKGLVEVLPDNSALTSKLKALVQVWDS